MQKKSTFILSVLILALLFSCGKNYKDISKLEFMDKVLPKVEINHVEVRNLETLLIYTNDKKPYKIKDIPPNSIDDFLKEIKSKNDNMYVSYTTESNNLSFKLIIFQLFTLIIPFLILAHIILLWISLRKIIKSEVDNMEKILYAIISIFFPFFGSVLYLTTKRR